MKQEEPLPAGACFLLILFGVIFDGIKMVLAFLYIGIVADPFFITPMAALAFGLVLSANGRSMFSGRRAAAGYINLIVGLIPILDVLPDWTAYAIYIVVTDRIKHRKNNGNKEV